MLFDYLSLLKVNGDKSIIILKNYNNLKLFA